MKLTPLGWFIFCIQLMFIFLKLTKQVDWNWFWTTSPVTGWISLILVCTYTKRAIDNYLERTMTPEEKLCLKIRQIREAIERNH